MVFISESHWKAVNLHNYSPSEIILCQYYLYQCILYQGCFADEFKLNEDGFKRNQLIPAELDMECLQHQFNEAKIEVEETVVTAAIQDVHDTTNFASALSGLLNR